VLSYIVLLIFGEPDDQVLVQEIQEEEAVGLLAAYGALSCFAAPIAEEIFFRGFMFRALAERVHVAWAALVTGVVFGLSHAAGSPATSLVVLSGFGVALCLLLYRTGSLIPCIMLHSFNNSVAFGTTKELPWWGILMLIVGSVGTTFLVSLLVSRRLQPSPP
jgi:membrane protease YdiL (CAAX protease family)